MRIPPWAFIVTCKHEQHSFSSDGSSDCVNLHLLGPVLSVVVSTLHRECLISCADSGRVCFDKLRVEKTCWETDRTSPDTNSVFITFYLSLHDFDRFISGYVNLAKFFFFLQFLLYCRIMFMTEFDPWAESIATTPLAHLVTWPDYQCIDHLQSRGSRRRRRVSRRRRSWSQAASSYRCCNLTPSLSFLLP